MTRVASSAIPRRSPMKLPRYYEVSWATPHDPFNPQQWSTTRRVFATMCVCLIALVTTMASAIDSAVLSEASRYFGVAQVAESLATGLYLIGFGVGALIASPMSEIVGRFPVYIGALVIFGAWILGAALAPNFGAQLAFRFLAGLCGSAPLTVAGGSISDVWTTLEKTFGFPIFAIPGFGGPILGRSGPVVGAYIGYSPHISWRWAEWIMLIFDGLVIVIIFLFKRETFAPQLLYYKARFFREATGDARFKTAVEASGTGGLLPVLVRNFTRPWQLLMEPIVIFFTFYLSIVYIVLFTFLDGYVYIFADVYGINEGLANICFLGLFIGILTTMVLVPILYHKTAKQLREAGDDGSGRMLDRESRLFFAQIGAPAIPIGLFWMGWTDYPSISIWSPLAASVAVGFGVICIFLSAYMYIIDSYQQYAASALTFVALVRYLAAGGMTVVGVPMYRNLGTHWTLTVLGIISAVAAPIPYVLTFWGPSLRKRSKWATAISS
ncbi:MFS general substrate transporter [Aspergillus sclerotiicarbonarius CBS 121057]|uniref:MFS general substrate transporter n=1 Tax=Aspergillus sclerotiicarbonarius (strain CBS 121057 / IBT 28362) TaxID=1448318 RepID=A0A319FLH9_ASPSB|nr:MFS general substrate transporter [Aspergillus sclerotiicarbonarius CBS 121057]